MCMGMGSDPGDAQMSFLELEQAKGKEVEPTKGSRIKDSELGLGPTRDRVRVRVRARARARQG